MKMLNFLLKYLLFASVKYPHNTLIMSSNLFYIFTKQTSLLILFYYFQASKLKYVFSLQNQISNCTSTDLLYL